MSILFLSDGKPSDHIRLRLPPNNYDYIYQITKLICDKYRERLTFGFFGFAHDNGSTFQLLKNLAHIANQSRCNGIFSSGLDTNNLKESLKLMTKSLTSTRTKLSTLAHQNLGLKSLGRIKRDDHVEENDKKQ